VKILKEVISQKVQVPPRETLEKFFLAILTELSTFQALNGFLDKLMESPWEANFHHLSVIFFAIYLKPTLLIMKFRMGVS
jgi:hypothetical protein